MKGKKKKNTEAYSSDNVRIINDFPSLQKLKTADMSAAILSSLYRCGEHLDQLHHSMEWQLHCNGQESSSESRENVSLIPVSQT
ncbi:hypothetical protein P4O66_010249 [Electrophorus voltai]|uniref:Uncharacterized protein n=1 Tax=Electrophorus voltai TaxID=2609070 RepID=A0AAD9DTT9_9TELE|nr:hypothetical protein P4O66_010249 [Electrophorus voltai]